MKTTAGALSVRRTIRAIARPRRYPSRRAIVLEGIIAVADCDDEAPDEEWNRAWSRFWEAVRAAGWAPKDDEAEGAQ